MLTHKSKFYVQRKIGLLQLELSARKAPHRTNQLLITDKDYSKKMIISYQLNRKLQVEAQKIRDQTSGC